MDWKTAAVSGGAGILGNIVGGLFGRSLQKYQNEWNLEMWHRQNEYNSPIQQMARYQEAGLNPNLIYSQGSPGNSQLMPTSAENKYQPDMSFVGDAIMQGHQAATMQSQQLVNESIAEKNLSEANLNNQEYDKRKETNPLEKEGLVTDNATKKFMLDTYLPAQVDEINQRIDESGARVNYMAAQIDEIDHRIGEIISRTNLNNTQAFAILKKLPHEINLINQQINESVAREHLSYAQAEQCVYSCVKLYEEAINIAASRDGIYYDNFTKLYNSYLAEFLNDHKEERWALEIYKGIGETVGNALFGDTPPESIVEDKLEEWTDSFGNSQGKKITKSRKTNPRGKRSKLNRRR